MSESGTEEIPDDRMRWVVAAASVRLTGGTYCHRHGLDPFGCSKCSSFPDLSEYYDEATTLIQQAAQREAFDAKVERLGSSLSVRVMRALDAGEPLADLEDWRERWGGTYSVNRGDHSVGGDLVYRVELYPDGWAEGAGPVAVDPNLGRAAAAALWIFRHHEGLT